jgi:transcription termination/antitermination protein NusG
MAPACTTSSTHEAAAREWFAVQVRARREHLAAHHLRDRGYEVFLPCRRSRRQWTDRVKTVESPLFPGYLFSRLTSAVEPKMVTAPGVIRIVGDGVRSSAIPAAEIDAIRCIVDTQLQAEPWTFVTAGERVRIDVGPLRGTEGVVLTNGEKRRLVVSITLLQRSVAVEIDRDWVSLPSA